MHDIDRTQTEFEPEADAFESYQFEFDPTQEAGIFGETDTEAPLEEVEEMELASDLLEVSDEAELDQFLGKLIKRAGRAVGKFVKSPTGRMLGGFLKKAAKVALPIAGRALGTYFGGPGGAAIGGQLGSAFGQAFGPDSGGPAGAAIGGQVTPAMGQMFGLELEGLSPEDQEFEVARRFVRFATSAAKQAALAPPTISPVAATKAAVTNAARKHAPGLLQAVRPAAPSVIPGGGRTGRWIRRGRKIILFGV